MLEFSWATASVGCGWAFYGLFLALSNANYEKFPKLLKVLAWPFSRKPVSLWLCTAFLLLVHLDWQPGAWQVYFFSGISYSVVGAFVPSFKTEAFLDLGKKSAWGKNVLKVIVGGILYGLAAIPLLFLHERYSHATLLYCIVFSLSGSIGGFLVMCYKFKGEKENTYISWAGIANFLLGIGIGLGVNMILY